MLKAKLEEEDGIRIYVGTDFGDDASPVGVVLCYEMKSNGSILMECKDKRIDTGNECNNPGWMLMDKVHKCCWIWMENDEGMIYRYPMEGNTILPTVEWKQRTHGQHPCYGILTFPQNNQQQEEEGYLLTAHYGNGNVTVLSTHNDDVIIVNPGSTNGVPKIEDGYHHDRQESSHAHCIVSHPNSQLNLFAVCDLGFSTVTMYQLDPKKEEEELTTVTVLQLRPEDGCRHCVWSPDGQYLYIQNELSCTLTIASWDEVTMRLQEVSTINILPSNVIPNRNHHCGNSHLLLHPYNPHILYMGIRSSTPTGTIAILDVSSPKQPIVKSYVSTHGMVPRHFSILQQQKQKLYLVVGNQESKTIVLFTIHPHDGTLTYTSQTSTAPYKPCHIASTSSCT